MPKPSFQCETFWLQNVISQSPCQHMSKFGPQTSSNGTTWDLVRNANSQTDTPSLIASETVGVGPGNLRWNEPLDCGVGGGTVLCEVWAVPLFCRFSSVKSSSLRRNSFKPRGTERKSNVRSFWALTLRKHLTNVSDSDHYVPSRIWNCPACIISIKPSQN